MRGPPNLSGARGKRPSFLFRLDALSSLPAEPNCRNGSVQACGSIAILICSLHVPASLSAVGMAGAQKAGGGARLGRGSRVKGVDGDGWHFEHHVNTRRFLVDPFCGWDLFFFVGAFAEFAAERRAAIQAVAVASRLCTSVFKALVSAETITKKDNSPVTGACGHAARHAMADEREARVQSRTMARRRLSATISPRRSPMIPSSARKTRRICAAKRPRRSAKRSFRSLTASCRPPSPRPRHA